MEIPDELSWPAELPPRHENHHRFYEDFDFNEISTVTQRIIVTPLVTAS